MSKLAVSNGASHPKKRAIFVLSQKGGVGKTTWCRGYLDRARSAGLRVAAFDADGQVGQLVQYYGSRTDGKLDDEQDPFVGVGWFNVRDSTKRDMLVNAAVLDADIILMDMPGGSVHELAKVFGDERSLFEVYKARGFDVVVVMVIGNIMASVRTVSETIAAFGDAVDYVVVKNLWFTQADDFRIFDGFENHHGVRRHGKGRELLLKHSGQTVVMEKLDPMTYELLDSESTAFSRAAENPDLTIAHITRVKLWLNAFEASLKETVLAL